METAGEHAYQLLKGTISSEAAYSFSATVSSVFVVLPIHSGYEYFCIVIAAIKKHKVGETDAFSYVFIDDLSPACHQK